MTNIEAALDCAGTSRYTVILLSRSQHNLTVHSDTGQSFRSWRIARGNPDLLVAWIQQLSRR